MTVGEAEKYYESDSDWNIQLKLLTLKTILIQNNIVLII